MRSRCFVLAVLAAASGCPARPASPGAPAAEAAARGEPEVRTERTLTVAGRPVVEITPPGARGTVLLFHGLGGSVDAWRERPDMHAVAEGLVADGWQVVAIGAGDTTEHRWDLSGLDSPDVRAVGEVIAKLPPGRVVHAVGHSQGAGMAVLAGAAHALASVVAVHGIGAPSRHADLTLPPTLFVAAERDSVVPPERVRLGYETARRAGAEVGWLSLGPSPLTVDALARAADVDPGVASAALSAARAAGLVDAQDVPAVHPLLARARWEAAWLPVLGELPHGPRAAVRDLLLVAYAEHPLPAASLPAIRAWLDQHPAR